MSRPESSSPLISGELGCRLIHLPAGEAVDFHANEPSRERLNLNDKDRKISWSIRYFDNLHMDLRKACRSDLEEDIRK